jgi:SAM-dependent methyltransferase
MHAGTYDFFLWPLDRLSLRRVRARVLASAQGKTLELGVGTGLNLAYYPPGVEVTGVEPDASMREKALARGVRVVEGDAQKLAFPDEFFDTVCATLVFCSVDDWQQGLREAVRVLKPGGLLLLAEHVRPRGALGKLADALTPLWASWTDGCRLNRDPEYFLGKLGLASVESGEFWLGLGRWWVRRKA